ncbi:MAG: ComEC/Rec2 family competence protein [Gammaproteobacteria bacterium]
MDVRSAFSRLAPGQVLYAARGVGWVGAGFCSGVLALLTVPRLPDAAYTQWLAVALLGLAPARTRCLGALAAGFLWALWRAHLVAADGLDPNLVGVDLVVEGDVAGLVTQSGGRTRFEFAVDAAHDDQGRRLGAEQVPELVRLSWTGPPVRPGAGERWRLRVRLRHPRGFSNPAGFDYERWLFVRGIRATGYVKKAARINTGAGALADNVRLAGAPRWSLAAARERTAAALRARAGASASPAGGWIAALSVGDRSGISPAEWQVLRDTGTAHLMAISGLHVGLAAGLGAAVVRASWWVWTFVPPWPRLAKGARSQPLERARTAMSCAVWMGVAALAFAFAYAALAGFSVSTRRALVMVSVGVAVTLLKRVPRPSNAVVLALLAVLVVDPLAPMQTGFWLSFIAVTLIVFGISGRPGARAHGTSHLGTRWTGRMVRWTRVQFLIAAGTLPVALALFGQHPPASPLANAIAVPWVSALVVPPILGAILLMPLWPDGASMLLGFALGAIEWLWPVLQWLADHMPLLYAPMAPSLWVMAAGLLGAFALLGPGGLGLRWPALLLLAASFVPGGDRVDPGALRVSMLDVGQGLAIVLETRDHVVVYDTGPGFPSGFNAGAAAVAPYLRHRGVEAVHMLILSHANRDHTGGVPGLIEAVPVLRVIGDAPGPAISSARVELERCAAGRRFELDGVQFELLHPPAGPGSGATDPSDNNQSCVVMVRAGRAALLLTGDLEAAAERTLVAAYGDRLAADIMVVPHHGSATSSTPGLLDAVKPRWALLSAGYRNHFRFPRADVLRRYASRSVPIVSTGAAGAVSFELSADGRIEGPACFRSGGGRFWHRLNPPEDWIEEGGGDACGLE